MVNLKCIIAISIAGNIALAILAYHYAIKSNIDDYYQYGIQKKFNL